MSLFKKIVFGLFLGFEPSPESGLDRYYYKDKYWKPFLFVIFPLWVFMVLPLWNLILSVAVLESLHLGWWILAWVLWILSGLAIKRIFGETPFEKNKSVILLKYLYIASFLVPIVSSFITYIIEIG